MKQGHLRWVAHDPPMLPTGTPLRWTHMLRPSITGEAIGGLVADLVTRVDVP